MSEAENTTVDWSDCPLVEIKPRKVSGAPILKCTRVQADSIVQNYEGGESVEDIAYNFSIPQDSVRQLLAFGAPVATEGFMDGIDDLPVQEREPLMAIYMLDAARFNAVHAARESM